MPGPHANPGTSDAHASRDRNPGPHGGTHHGADDCPDGAGQHRPIAELIGAIT